ncbi:MAG: hypothetical protein GX141_10055 [Armatimonadetes bacterium]|nr:hypothetical protein [Armatimonadota bacterium]
MPKTEGKQQLCLFSIQKHSNKKMAINIGRCDSRGDRRKLCAAAWLIMLELPDGHSRGTSSFDSDATVTSC